MPPPSKSSDFLQLLGLSNLVEKPKIVALTEKYSDLSTWPPARVADLFVKAKLISRFQADQLLAGRHRGFFIGKYKILSLIGSGGMGRVYLAEHAIMRRRVALKVLPKGKSSDPSALGRFQREARAVAALRHPNIVQAYDIDQEGDIHFIVMEFVDGISVQEYVRRHGPMQPEIAADIIAQACDALDHASESGLVHRDIKPGNLVVDKTGTVKLLDMGLAVFYDEKERDPLTLEYDENVLGTADYLAPEQALDSHNVDIRADIYSLGGTFYYMLTGRAPFPEGTIAQKLLWHQNRHPQLIREIDPTVPQTVEKIVRKMMAKDPKNRFQTPREVRDILAPYAKRQAELFQETELSSDLADASSKSRQQAPTSDQAPAGNADFAAGIPASPAADRPSARRRKPREEVEVPPPVLEETATPFEEASVLTAPAPADTSVAGDSADFLRSLAETTTSSSRLTPKSSSSQSAIDSIKEKMRDPQKKKVLLWIAAGGGGGLLLLLLVSLTWMFSSDGPATQTPPLPATATATKGPDPDANSLIVSRNPTGAELLLDEALYEVKRGQKIRLRTDGPTTWEVSNLRIEPETIAAEEVTLVGSGPDTVLSLPKSLEGALLTIRDTPGFVLADMILDGGGKPGPVLEIIGPRAAGVELRNITIRNFKGVGIRITNIQGKANQPVILDRVLVECSDSKNVGIAIMPPAPTGSAGRSYYARLAGTKVVGPFALGLKIEQPINSLVVDACTFAKGTAGVGLFAKEMDWSKLQLTNPIFESLTEAVVSDVGPDAITKLDWKEPVFKEVKNPPTLASDKADSATPTKAEDSPPTSN